MTTDRKFNLAVAATLTPCAFAHTGLARPTCLIIPFPSRRATDIVARTCAAVVMCAGIKPD